MSDGLKSEAECQAVLVRNAARIASWRAGLAEQRRHARFWAWVDWKREKPATVLAFPRTVGQ